MERKRLRWKRSNMKIRFVVNRFFLYFLMFTMPIILLGGVFSWRLYWLSLSEQKIRMENSLNMCADNLESYTADAKALNMYIENGNQTLYFYKMFLKEKVDYASLITMGHLSSYLVSLKSSKDSIDSVYFYMENRLNRVLTSEKLITDYNTMKDNGWWEEFDRMAAGETRIASRLMYKDDLMVPYEVYSVFSRFQNYKGGTVINYNAEAVRKALQMMVFYDQQSLLCLDSQGRLLLANEAYNREQGTMPPDEEKYFILWKNDQPSSYKLATMIPNSAMRSHMFVNMQLVIQIMAMTILSSIILSYYQAVRSYRQLHGIIELFERAENCNEMTELPAEEHDIYAQILNNIIRTFIRYSYIKVQLSERKYRQMATELIALQYQINPHFLFNTLQAINYEILDITRGKMTQANHMLEYLSDILRYALTAPDKPITIEEEIKYCKKYIAIQQMRYENKVKVEWQVDNDLLGFPVDRLLLQPLVENSVSHGIRDEMECVVIRIRIRHRREKIRFEIIDNGAGIRPDHLQEIKRMLSEDGGDFASEHIGLKNINQRLILGYSQESHIHLFSKYGMGTMIYFEVPKNS